MQLVQLQQPGDGGEAPIWVNPEHVVLVEPLAAQGRALCRVWLAAPVGPERAWHRDVIGPAAAILKKLATGGGDADPLGSMGGARPGRRAVP